MDVNSENTVIRYLFSIKKQNLRKLQFRDAYMKVVEFNKNVLFLTKMY